MPTTEATREVRDVLAGRPGGVNQFIRRFGKPVVDYVTALMPDRSEPFARIVEDILVDAISQVRAAARSQSDDEVFAFVMDAALHTVRARYGEILSADAKPDKATNSWTFQEVLERTKISEVELTESISSGRIRAVRENDQMRIKGQGVDGLDERKAYYAYHVTAAERELLCLHYRLGFSPDEIARFSGSTTVQIENLIGKASSTLAAGLASKRGSSPGQEDTEIRRYIDGRMGDDETTKFETSILKNKIAQKRLDELRGESQAIKELFDSEPYDLSSIAVNVRSRNPHHAISLPPVAALWLQVVGIVAMVLVFHSVGAYLAPPDVRVSAARGEVELPADGRMGVGDVIETKPGAQALMVLDDSNRVLMAPNTYVRLLEPRTDARQVLGVKYGEIWGRFTSSGHAFLIEFPGGDEYLYDISSTSGADFDLIVGDDVAQMLPDNLAIERPRAFAATFDGEEALAAPRAIQTLAGYRFGNGDEDSGLRQGDEIERVGSLEVTRADELEAAVAALQTGDSVQLTVLRDDARVSVELTRYEELPRAVLRVFHGSVIAGAGDQNRTLVNRHQWAVFVDGQTPMVGRRGVEDFRVLRIDSSERFKNNIHWLNTESYPLRAENSVVQVDRELNALAGKLEAMRAHEIRRSGEREIRRFQTLMQEAIEAAEQRIAEEKPREAEEGQVSLSDEQLVAAKDEILSIIEHWRKQAATGIHPTLGSAGKTLHSRIQKFRDELEVRGEELTRSLLLQGEITDLEASIKIQEEALADLKASENFDSSGEKRAEIDTRIAELQKVVRAGSEAESRIELLKIKLNDLDEKIDDERRKLPDLKAAVEAQQDALAGVNTDIAANPYTPEKLQQAKEAVTQAEADLATAETRLEALRVAGVDANANLSAAETRYAEAKSAVASHEETVDEASDALTDAIATRAAAQSTVEDAQAEVDRLQAELDALEENDPGRADKEAELAIAEEALDSAISEQDAAMQAANDAQQELEQAENALEAAQSAQQSALSDRDQKRKEANAAEDAITTQDALITQHEAAQVAAEGEVAHLEAKKAALEESQAEKAEIELRLQTAQANLKTVEDEITRLEGLAHPQREELATELQLVQDAEDARKAIADLRTERGKFQAISDEITIREADRASLVEDRDRIAGSNLVVSYERLTDEYAALSRRIGAHEFVRARALSEDQNFDHEQQAARDRFQEAAENAEIEAVEILSRFCPQYNHEAYGVVSADSATREGVLRALWKLYYDAGVTGPSDEDENICYYVAVQADSGTEVFERMDSRWQAYLMEALGSDGFNDLANLEPAMLGPKKD